MNTEKINREKGLSRLSPQESIKAVENGSKPLSFFKEEMKTDLPHLTFESSMLSSDDKDRVTRIFKEKNYIYYRAGQEHNAERIKELVIQRADEQTSGLKVGDVYIHKPPRDEYHRELGKLLGYSEKEIEEFIKRPHH